MIRRHKKSVLYRCDHPQCRAEHVAPFGDFKLAWANAKAAGWITATHAGKWFHFCSWVHRPNDDAGLAALTKEKANAG